MNRVTLSRTAGPAAYPDPGWYPAAYRISYDAQAREYRIALTQLTWHSE